MSVLKTLIDNNSSDRFEFSIYDQNLKKSIQVQVCKLNFKYKQNDLFILTILCLF